MSNAASQARQVDRRRQRSDEDGTEVDCTAPLAVALMRAGLSEQQIVQDNWTALFSLPQEVVNVFVSAFLYHDPEQAVLEDHATLDVLKVTPSSPLSCELWCKIVSYFLFDNRNLIGTAEVRDALPAMQPHVATEDSCVWWCHAISSACNSCEFFAMTPDQDANKQLFGTADVRDALVALQLHVTTARAC